METSKVTSRLIGILFISAIITYGSGNSIIESILTSSNTLTLDHSQKSMMAVGAILMLLNSFVVIGIGILFYPILKVQNKAIALAYFSSRIIESVILIVGIIFLLLQIPLSEEVAKTGQSQMSYFQTLRVMGIKGNYYSYQIAMIALGLGSILFCYSVYKSQIIPRFLSMWGGISYSVFLLGAVFELLGNNIGLMLSIPGGLFEMFLGVWLIVKGLNFTKA